MSLSDDQASKQSFLCGKPTNVAMVLLKGLYATIGIQQSTQNPMMPKTPASITLKSACNSSLSQASCLLACPGGMRDKRLLIPAIPDKAIKEQRHTTNINDENSPSTAPSSRVPFTAETSSGCHVSPDFTKRLIGGYSWLDIRDCMPSARPL